MVPGLVFADVPFGVFEGATVRYCSVNLVTARGHVRELCGRNLHNVVLIAVSRAPLRVTAFDY